jgi:hypothetical protein
MQSREEYCGLPDFGRDSNFEMESLDELPDLARETAFEIETFLISLDIDLLTHKDIKPTDVKIQKMEPHHFKILKSQNRVSESLTFDHFLLQYICDVCGTNCSSQNYVYTNPNYQGVDICLNCISQLDESTGVSLRKLYQKVNQDFCRKDFFMFRNRVAISRKWLEGDSIIFWIFVRDDQNKPWEYHEFVTGESLVTILPLQDKEFLLSFKLWSKCIFVGNETLFKKYGFQIV